MVDKATEAEWEKSKRIEAERMKAVRALETEKSDSANVAYLDPQTTKVKGWSSDKNVILASIERLGNRSVVLAVAGVALGVVGYGGGGEFELSIGNGRSYDLWIAKWGWFHLFRISSIDGGDYDW